jgi:radical SAM superfamily enzyme YgiQ (UPF0313 family)
VKILFINPNQYKHPPVPPLALEYLAGALDTTDHEAEVIDLCFEPDPFNALENKIRDFRPEIVGITIRQVDTALYPDNHFFLDEIKHYVSFCKQRELSVILGGSGFSIMPQRILSYTGADYGIAGAGEDALVYVLDTLVSGIHIPPVINGNTFHQKPYWPYKRKMVLDYRAYLENDGLIGFRTKTGCPGHCFFCVEGHTNVYYHHPNTIGVELKRLKERGFNRFHLCDSEFNIDLNHCINTCNAILRKSGKINWTAYMKPEPFTGELFELLSKTGLKIITLSLNTLDDLPSTFKQLKTFCQLAHNAGINIMVDLSVGAPYEDISTTGEMIDFLDEQPVKSVGVNAYYRVYPGTVLHQHLISTPDLQQYLVGESEHHDFLYPVFFNYIDKERIANLIKGKPTFRIEGFEKKVNYQRTES